MPQRHTLPGRLVALIVAAVMVVIGLVALGRNAQEASAVPMPARPAVSILPDRPVPVAEDFRLEKQQALEVHLTRPAAPVKTQVVTLHDPTRNIRNQPTTDGNEPVKQISEGSRVETVELVEGQDPYRDGRDQWLKLADGNYMWASGTDAGKVYGVELKPKPKPKPAAQTDQKSKPAKASPDGNYRLPLDHYIITSDFGEVSATRNYHPHRGLDFAAPMSTPLKAVAAGEVWSDCGGRGNGYTTCLKLDDGTVFMYGHLSDWPKDFREGMHVKAGDVIGLVGSTGNSTGPHVHLQYHPKGLDHDPVNPMKWFDQVGVSVPRSR